MDKKYIYLFPSLSKPTLSEVGGKALSLVEGIRAGLPVPQGFILSVTFFLPWFQEIKKTNAWNKFLHHDKYDLHQSCNSLKQHALKFKFTQQQEKALFATVEQYPQNALFAVRSSSPEEDLEGASFAGGYETLLGINKKSLKDAVKKAFVSCLDYRVAMYKKENGFVISDPKIAIIVQEQIPSDIAGVGFSLNPVTNNFDEAVITANWGLGETVVSGTVTPDTYTVDKISLHIHNKQLGTKETSIRVMPDGGTKEQKSENRNQFTLSDTQTLELTKLIKKVETLYQKPMDIEWAYVKEKLYLLQARPITTYVPLSEAMLTKPGEKKRLYIDFTLSLQGINKPVSVTGTSIFIILIQVVGNILFFRDMTRDITTAIPWISPGRMYINLSNLFKIVNKKKIANFLMILDPLAAKTLLTLNEKEYITNTNKFRLLPVGFVRIAPKIALQVLRARNSPKQTHKKSQQILAAFTVKAREIATREMPLEELFQTLLHLAINDVLLNTPPLFVTGKLALKEMKKIAGKKFEDTIASLEVALPHNVTTEMGLALYRVAKLIPPHINKNDLLAGIKNRKLSDLFLSEWDMFLTIYGFRGPLELDIAAPRYEDNPDLLISILFSMRDSTNQDNPEEKFRKNQVKNHTTYEHIYHEIEKKDKNQALKFQKQYEIFETFAGYRESHKFYVVYALSLVRKRILSEARILYEAGRLESIEQIFDLRLDEIDKAKNDSTLNLIALAKLHREFIDKLARIPILPTLIDSRGYIVRPQITTFQKGVITGTPISPGIVKGKIKVLHTPDEKPLLKGEILVARATDPGWTPLFANAGAVILEIGGVLQHGALVAREYGLPCVAGVENATYLWKDGTPVEINGSEGTITVIS